MAVSIISNCDEYNHYNFLTKYSKMADRIIIVSPFLSADISRLLSGMPTIKCVELYTNLDGYGMAINVLPAIRELYEYCKDKEISVSVKYNNHLHGKVYLLYKGNESKGCIITSGNFTNNGLKSNHEYGVFIDNESMQERLKEQIYRLECSKLSYSEVIGLAVFADEFAKKHLSESTPVFKVSDCIKNRVIMPDNCKFFLKPLGNNNRPVGEGYTIIEDNQIGFKKPIKISKGDILICHGSAVGNVLGVCKVIDEKPKEGVVAFEGDTWNCKYATKCISEKYSSRWWDYNIKTLDLVNEYIKVKEPHEHVTAVGGDTIGALQHKKPYIKITKEFAQFVMDSISKL